MAFRKPFSEDDDNANKAPPPARNSLACTAERCPMPGTIVVGSPLCAWHYGRNAFDWPRVTRVLLDWSVVGEEINAARRVLSDPRAVDGKGARIAFEDAVRRLRGSFNDGVGATSLMPRQGWDYGSWMRHLQQEMENAVRLALREST